jgi:hypothetical protein
MRSFVAWFSPRVLPRWGLLLVPLVLLGCGDQRPKRVPISGRVTIDGKPLDVGCVQVQPEGHRAAYGTIGPDGRFQLTTYEPNDGCVLGEHPLVIVNAHKKLNETTGLVCAPEKYQFPQTSGLKLSVQGPRDDANFDLTWKGSGRNGPYRFEIERK